MSAGMVDITNDTWDEQVVGSDQPVLVDFWAPWCGPCKVMDPVLDQLAEEHANVKFAKVNVDDNQDIAIRYDILSIPTLLLIEGGEVRQTLIGSQPRRKIEEALGTVG